MQLRELNVGCFGGGTGLPSLLGGLKNNPWLQLNAVVTMFDSGGSSGQLRDELGVLPPGDVLKCALALARNEGEARRVLLSRLPTMEHHARLSGHTGGNLLLSMMEQYSGNFLSAVDGLRALLGCKGRVWPVSVEPASLCVEYAGGSRARGESEVDAGQTRGQQIERLWLEPEAGIHPHVAEAITRFDAVIIGPGSFFTSIMPPLLVRGVKEALAQVEGPVILIANLLTEGSGMAGTLAKTGLRKLSRSGWITVMPAALNVSASLASCARISLSCAWPCVWTAPVSDCRSFALSACHAVSFTTMSRGVMMCPVRTRYFCTSKNLLLWMVGSGFSCPSTAPWLNAR